MADDAHADLKQTVLHAAHLAAGARMVPFAGYDMPVQYEGVLAEHRWTRASCGVFDVSHMGPCFLLLKDRSGDGEADHAAVSALIEPLVCGDIRGLKLGQIRYSVLLNAEGGMIDDLMIARPVLTDRQGMLYIIVNAAGKEEDFALIRDAADGKAVLKRADDRALIAVQGPKAEAVVGDLFPQAKALKFMHLARLEYEGVGVVVSRSGYTGEDGFEILIEAPAARSLWDRLMADARCRPVGLGARDSLRLEAGLPLYGHDADQSTSPVEAGLAFAVSRRRQREGDFPGAGRIAHELSGELERIRAGLLVEGAPAREGAEIADETGAAIGRVTSGGFSPSLNRPIAMGLIPPRLAAPGTRLSVVVRGRSQPAVVTPLPFVAKSYVR